MSDRRCYFGTGQHTLYKSIDALDALKEWLAIGIVVHGPESGEGRRESAKKAAALHAQAVVERMKALPCSTEQKIHMHDAIGQYIKK